MIQFRDIPLEKGESSHFYYDKCGEELHPDNAYTHTCSRLRYGKKKL